MSIRMRLVGTLAGAPVRVVVEVSGRNPVPRDVYDLNDLLTVDPVAHALQRGPGPAPQP